MKITIVVLFIATLMLSACGFSSQQEAIGETQKLPDFSRIISIKTVKGAWAFCPTTINLFSSKESRAYFVIHIVTYENKNDNIVTVCFDDQRPPKKIEEK